MKPFARTPNLIYIGPGKAGSTWIWRALSSHPSVYVTPAKDLYFFDRYYHRGLTWYLKHFQKATSQSVVAELSHHYLYSAEARERIASTLPDIRLMVCLREPVDRAFSAYLHRLKHGKFRGSFEESLSQIPKLIEHGMYAKHLRPYIDTFGAESLYVGVFDHLTEDPIRFAKNLFKFLQIQPLELPEILRSKALPASRPRSLAAVKIVRAGGLVARELGFPVLVGRVKSSPLVQRLLYRPYASDEKPRPDCSTARRLKELFAEDVASLDELLGSGFKSLWGYG